MKKYVIGLLIALVVVTASLFGANNAFAMSDDGTVNYQPSPASSVAQLTQRYQNLLQQLVTLQAQLAELVKKAKSGDIDLRPNTTSTSKLFIRQTRGLPYGVIGTSYNESLSAWHENAGGTFSRNYSWSIQGALPDGIMAPSVLSGTTTCTKIGCGITLPFSGTPTKKGAFPITVSGTIDNATGTRSFVITVREPGEPTSTPSSSVTMLAPVGGEVWNVGETHTIAWETNTLEKVFIFLQDATTDVIKYEIVGTPMDASVGSYSWKIPPAVAAGTNYKICVGYQSTRGCSGAITIRLGEIVVPSTNTESQKSSVASPTVTSVSVSSTVRGATVTVYGTNFSAAAKLSIDYPYGASISPSSVSSNKITFVVPTTVSVGSHAISVVQNGSQSNTVPLSVTSSATSAPATPQTPATSKVLGESVYAITNPDGSVSYQSVTVDQLTAQLDALFVRFVANLQSQLADLLNTAQN